MPPIRSKHIERACPYIGGRPIEEIQREFGLRSVVKLASNENPLGPSPKALAAMRKCARQMHLYPDGDAYYLRNAIAQKLGVSPDQVILGNGSDEISLFIMLCYLGPGRALACSEHSFIRYEMNAIIANGGVRRLPMKKWRHDVAALLGSLDGKTGVLAVANPENPTGSMITRRDCERLVRETPDHTLLLLDEAYFEYVAGGPHDPHSMRFLKKSQNLVVTRTFSKAYGLAGLRMGYGVSTPEIVETLNRVRPPFNVSRVAQEAAVAALEDEDHLARTREVNDEGLDFLSRACAAAGLETIDSRANFIAVNVRRPGADVFKALLPRGVIVRPLGGYAMPEWIRISVGLPKENRRCMRALSAALKEIPETGKTN